MTTSHTQAIARVAVLALTTSDLWPGEGWNFVFGQASLRGASASGQTEVPTTVSWRMTAPPPGWPPPGWPWRRVRTSSKKRRAMAAARLAGAWRVMGMRSVTLFSNAARSGMAVSKAKAPKCLRRLAR